MDRMAFALMALAAQWFRPRYNGKLQLLEAQIRILRSRIDTNRLVPTPAEKAELLRIGESIDHDVADVMHVVLTSTYRKWVRQRRKGYRFIPSGRPRIPLAARNLVLRMADENARWGFRRIVGELKKLGIRIGYTTARNILKDAGRYPDPNKARRKPPLPWTTFVHANMDSMVGCDFFTKRIYTLRGVVDAYVLVFIHLGSRKVLCSSSTYNPNAKWVTQQARNASMWLEENDVKMRYLIRDRDRKFPDEFDVFWKDEKARVIRIPIKAPKANAFSESFIESLKRECLNYFICFSRDQLDHILKVWLQHYHKERPHRGVGRDNTVLDEEFVPKCEGFVRSKQELGGIVRSYYREAA